MDNQHGSQGQLALMFDAPLQALSFANNVIPLNRGVCEFYGATKPLVLLESASSEESTIIQRVIAEAERLGW